MSLFRNLVGWYFSKKSLPYWCILILDFLLLIFAGILTYWIFIYRRKIAFDQLMLLRTIFIYALPAFVGIRMFHTYSGIIRYSSFIDLKRVLYANLVALCIAYPIHFLVYSVQQGYFYHLHFRHICLMYLIGTLLMWGMRVVVKSLYETVTTDIHSQRALIYGPIDSCIGLAKNIRSQTLQHYIIKGFISDEQNYKHTMLMGERVFNSSKVWPTVIRRLKIKAIVVTPQGATDFRENQALQDHLLMDGVKIYMTEHAQEMNLEDGESIKDKVHIKEVSVEDLLPRDEIKVDMKSMGEVLAGKRIMVTGAAGSIGSELVRQIAGYQPASLMLIDQAETPEHDVRLMLDNEFPDVQADVVVTSICKQDRMENIFSTFRPDYVFHAAAYKHVPMMEDNPSEAVQNNIFGTKVIADLSVKYGVKKFVMVSTDKAVNPTNVMGCSKRICEIYVQSLSRARNCKTQFVTTRFGNVLGSNGSVIPLFREQIRRGGPVTVTDKNIVRYFMLIPEACKLVLEAGTKGRGGEIFVFDMGKPVKIADLAARMIRLSGAKHVEIKYTGLRFGEKLYEEVLNDKENTKPTFHEKIRIAEVREYDYEQVSKDVDELVEISTHYDDMATVKKMKEIVPEYKSNNSKYEKLDTIFTAE